MLGAKTRDLTLTRDFPNYYMLPWPRPLSVSRTEGICSGELRAWREAMLSCQLARTCSVQMEPVIRRCGPNCQILHFSCGTSVLGTGRDCCPKVRPYHSCCDFCGCKLDRVKRLGRKERQGTVEKAGKARQVCFGEGLRPRLTVGP